jgi:hypothetical protein
MRTWGRVTDPVTKAKTWVEVTTDPVTGDNSLVQLTTLIQVLNLNLNESPFYGDWGLPARQAVIQSIAPDYNVMLTQQRFAPYFASLLVSRVGDNPPTYLINATTKQGVKFVGTIPQ